MLDLILPFVGGFFGGNVLFKDPCQALKSQIDTITKNIDAQKANALRIKRDNPNYFQNEIYQAYFKLVVDRNALARELLVCSGEASDALLAQLERRAAQLNATTTGKILTGG